MLLRDLKGIYLPATYVMLGMSTLIVCLCAAEPVPPEATGPTGSTMICVFYFIFHVLFWIPLGAGLIALQWYRYRKPIKVAPAVPYLVTSNDNVRHVIGAIVGGSILLLSFLALIEPLNCLVILLMSVVTNFIPAAIFYGFGSLLTSARRQQNEEAEQVMRGNRR